MKEKTNRFSKVICKGYVEQRSVTKTESEDGTKTYSGQLTVLDSPDFYSTLTDEQFYKHAHFIFTSPKVGEQIMNLKTGDYVKCRGEIVFYYRRGTVLVLDKIKLLKKGDKR